MEDSGKANRVHKLLNDIETRVENLRRQAQSLEKEKLDLLEVLQDLQDGTSTAEFSEADQEDIDYNTERLIIRCLTVDVSISTPRNDAQEQAFETVTKLIDELSKTVEFNPRQQFPVVESYLNACLPEPISSNIDMRFQEKLLSCTVDDQKRFRKRLEKLRTYVKVKLEVVNKRQTDDDTSHNNDGNGSVKKGELNGTAGKDSS